MREPTGNAALPSLWCGATFVHEPHEWSYDRETFACSGYDFPDDEEDGDE